MGVWVICFQLTPDQFGTVIGTVQTGNTLCFTHITNIVYTPTIPINPRRKDVVIIPSERMAINCIAALSLTFSILGTFIARGRIIFSPFPSAWFGGNQNSTYHRGKHEEKLEGEFHVVCLSWVCGFVFVVLVVIFLPFNKIMPFFAT